MEKVVFDNFFDFFHEFPGNFFFHENVEKVVFDNFSTICMIPKTSSEIRGVEKVVKNDFFHDLGFQNGLSRGKSCF